MLEDLFKALRSHVADRLASPLMGAFAVSWCLWNYKFLVILFSSEPVERTFALVDSIAYPTNLSVVTHGAIFPALTAALYIFAYPYPAKFVFAFTRQRQREILEIKRKIEDETPLTLEESRKIRSELVKIEQEYFAELERNNAEIERLRTLVSSLQSPAPVPERSTEGQKLPAVTPSQVSLLKVIEAHGGKIPEKNLARGVPGNRTKVEYDIGELSRLELISRVYDNGFESYVYTFTHLGRSVLLAQEGELADA